MKSHPVSYSQIEMTTLMLPHHANPYMVVHGGEVIKLIDNAAGVVAHRHSRSRVVTARIDDAEFHLPIRIGSVVTCHGKMTFVGHSSMEVAVVVTAENAAKDEPVQTALTAYLTYVALDESGKPCQVPELELHTDEERQQFEAGRERYLAYKQRRQKKNSSVCR